MPCRIALTCLILAALHGETPAPPATSSPAVVVELFTSEACAACIPAERLVNAFDAGSVRGAKLGKGPSRGTPAEVIVLAEHVDYFDSDAWSDRHSSPLFSARQQDYGKAMQRSVMYTPQVIVNGEYEVNDPDMRKISVAIRDAARAPRARASLAFTSKDKFILRVGALPAGSHTADVLLAVAESGIRISVSGGENKGQVLAHAPVVHRLMRMGEIEPGSQGEFIAEAKLNVDPNWIRERVRLVLLVQDRSTRHILGAAALKLNAANSR